MRKLFCFAILLCLLVFATKTPLKAGDKEEIIKLKEQVIVLQTNIRDLKESADKNSGQLSTLLTQAVDSISVARRDVTETRQIVDRRLGDMTTAANDTSQEVSRLNERLNATDTRLERLEVQLKKLEGYLTRPDTTMNCENEQQLFGQANGDYIRGNYGLAIAQFQTYVRCFSQTEQAGLAQYLIGDSYYKQYQYKQAAEEFDKLLRSYPTNTKVNIARLKRADSLLKSDMRKEAEAELKLLIQVAPGTQEAKQAQEVLSQLPPEPVKPPVRPRR
jgi:TolA-binding protein